VTSALYLELIQSFEELNTKKQTELFRARERYENGLKKLKNAAFQVSAL
jgi:hypothetical protein